MKYLPSAGADYAGIGQGSSTPMQTVARGMLHAAQKFVRIVIHVIT